MQLLSIGCAFFCFRLGFGFQVYASGPSHFHVEDSLSPKAYLMQYCDNEIPTSPVPKFLLARASPLTGTKTALFARIASRNALSAHINSFCKSANLFCGKDAELPNGKEFSTHLTHSPISINFMVSISFTYNNKQGDVEHDFMIPGTFFREKMLKSGTITLMPDIRNRIPKRSFLPRSIESKLPFSSSKFQEVKHIFLTSSTSKVEAWMNSTLRLCELKPNAGETKRYIRSAEDMIDFAVSKLGRLIKIRTTENTNGSGKDVMLDKVRAVAGGKAIDTVSCHQAFYPYLVYLCHALPNSHVYEVDILDSETKVKINQGSAICHLDTSSWRSNHPAFLLLESTPGEIEVCHWLYQNDFVWTIDA